MTDPMNALWRAQQDAAANFTDSWRTLLQPAGDRTAAPAAPSGTADAEDPEQVVDAEPDDVDGVAEPEVAEPEVAEPEPQPSVVHALQAVRALRDGQHDLAQHLTRWADLQRDLAETTSVWARRQRDHADALDRLLASFPPAPAERPVESWTETVNGPPS